MRTFASRLRRTETDKPASPPAPVLSRAKRAAAPGRRDTSVFASFAVGPVEPRRAEHASASGGGPLIQRQCAKCEEEEEQLHMPAQRKAAEGKGQEHAAQPAGALLPPGPGRPLDAATREYFEPRFGHDLGGVRVHTDSQAASAARDINAVAFTMGQNIVFGQDAFAPQTTTGKRLLAHELTHFIQQNQPAGGGDGQLAWRFAASAAPPISGITRPDDASELQADRVADAVVSTAAPLPRAAISSLSGPAIQKQEGERPTSENVWGINVNRSMCDCRPRIQADIDWANTAAATYASCDTPANPTANDVEACFSAAHPSATVVASTSPSGTITMPAATADPCDRISHKATFVHEIFHSRHADDMARAQGAAFFREWRRLAGDPDRLEKLRLTFPAEVAAFEAQWNDGHDWAQDEVRSYTWERRFLTDALRALNRIC